MKSLLHLSLAAMLTLSSSAATLAVSFDNLNAPIPDGSALGLNDQRLISTTSTILLSLSVTLNLTGGFNGDLYVQLTHDSGFSVLLNRVGRDAANVIGYTDSGFNVSFNDAAPAGDVHTYRTIATGNAATPLAGPLTGTWAPDGRATDPANVVTADARTAMLGSFIGVNPNGVWTLFIADLDGGGVSTLNSWSLNAEVVPEPSGLMALSASLILWSAQRRRKSPGFTA